MTIYITKNVTAVEDIPLIVSDGFVETYPVAFIRHPISFSVSSPSLAMKGTAEFDSSISFVSGEPIVEYTPASSATYEATTANCYLHENGSFKIITATDGYMGMGSYIASGLGMKAWLPFVVTLPQGQGVISATVNLTASETRSRDDTNVKMGCESFSYASGDITSPTSYSSLNRRVLTSAVAYYSSVAHWTINIPYSFDITASVQEILNKADWVSGYRIAVMIWNNASTPNMDREFWGAGNTTSAYRPSLTINV